MKIKSMKELVSEMKDIISLEVEAREGKPRKILDKDLSEALGVSPSVLGTSKNREKILYSEIAVFCAIRKISLNLLLFSQSAESLVESSHRYECHKYGLSQTFKKTHCLTRG